MAEKETDKDKRKSACKLKQEYTSHWDLDALPQDELDELMLKDRGESEDRGQKAEDSGATESDGEMEDEVEENPLRIGGMLLGFSVAALVVGWLILRLG